MIKRKKWLLVVLALVAVGLIYAGYSLFGNNMADYLTVSEVKTGMEISDGQHVVVKGIVAPGSISWNAGEKVIRFVLTDGQENLTVVYNGIMPDNFKPGVELVVVGKYGTDGVFAALSFGKGDAFCGACHG